MLPSVPAMNAVKNNSAINTAGVITEILFLGNESLIGPSLSLIVNVRLLP